MFLQSLVKTTIAALVPASLMLGSASPDLTKTMTENDALLQRATREYDAATVRQLITDDFTLITSSARVYDAKQLLDDVADRSVKWKLNQTEDLHVRSYNDDCAIITATLHQQYEYQGKMHDYRVRFTDTWVKLDGRWRYAAGHASLLKQ
jgi:ketosteroid isomerase-like protein